MKKFNKICISFLVSFTLLFNVPCSSFAEVTSDAITNEDLIIYVSQSIGFKWSSYNGDDIYNDFVSYCNANNLKSDCVGTLVADTLSIPKDTYNNITSFLGTFTSNKISDTIYSNGFLDIGLRFKTVKDSSLTSFNGVYYNSLSLFNESNISLLANINDKYPYYSLSNGLQCSYTYYFDDGLIIDGVAIGYGSFSSDDVHFIVSLRSSVSLTGKNINRIRCRNGSCLKERYSSFIDSSIIFTDNGYYYYLFDNTEYGSSYTGPNVYLYNYYLYDKVSFIKLLWSPFSSSPNSYSYSFSSNTQSYIDTPSNSNVTIIINNINTDNESISTPDYTSALGDIKDLIKYYGDKILDQNNVNSEVDNNIIDNANKNNDIFNDTSSKFNDIEKEFTNDLDSNLNSIDTSTDFSFNGGGSYFKNSINWVNTQFNKMTNSTPFGSILGFSLILGLALLLLGKLFK